NGEICGTNLVVRDPNRSIPVGDLDVKLSNDGQEKTMTLESSFANATLRGTFDYTVLGDILTSEFNRYMQVSDTLVPIAGPYNFQLTGYLQQHEAIKAFLPQLTRLDRVNFNLKVADKGDTTFSLSAFAPR